MKALILATFLCSNLALAESVNMNLTFETPRILEMAANTHLATIDGRLVGQKEGAWKHSVYLEIKSNGISKSCSGTILAKDTILTAAHCVSGDVTDVMIYFGHRSAYNFSAIRLASQFATPSDRMSESVPKQKDQGNGQYLNYNKTAHEKFNNNFQSLTQLEFRRKLDKNFIEDDLKDLALIFFKGGVPKGFSSAKFYSGPAPELKEVTYSYGYGVDTRNLNHTTRQLRESKGKVYSYSIFGEDLVFFKAYSGSSSGNLCAGDSGGGTYFKNSSDAELKLIAINITANNNCANGDGHLMVHKYLPWIAKMIEKYRGQQYY